MKKKFLSILLSTAMIATVLAGCGKGTDTSSVADQTKADTEEEAAAEKSSEEEPAKETAEDDQICRKYADLSAEGLHYSAAFSGGDIAMLNMGSWFISTMITKLQSGEYDSSLCGNRKLPGAFDQ